MSQYKDQILYRACCKDTHPTGEYFVGYDNPYKTKCDQLTKETGIKHWVTEYAYSDRDPIYTLVIIRYGCNCKPRYCEIIYLDSLDFDCVLGIIPGRRMI